VVMVPQEHLVVVQLLAHQELMEAQELLVHLELQVAAEHLEVVVHQEQLELVVALDLQVQLVQVLVQELQE